MTKKKVMKWIGYGICILLILLVLSLCVRTHSVKLSFPGTGVRLDFNIYGLCIDRVPYSPDSVNFAHSLKVLFLPQEDACLELARQLQDIYGAQGNFSLDMDVEGFLSSHWNYGTELEKILEADGIPVRLI